MVIVREAPENHKTHARGGEEGASGGPAGARWLLRSSGEGMAEWLNRVRSKLLSLWETSDPRQAQVRAAWARALILAQAKIRGDRDVWHRALEAVQVAAGGEADEEDVGPRSREQYATRCASTALAFPEVAAYVLGLDAAEVSGALAIPDHVQAPIFRGEEVALVAGLGFREFWRRRGDPPRARRELLDLAGRSQVQEYIPEAACQVLTAGDAVTRDRNNSDYSRAEAEGLEESDWGSIPRLPENACQVLSAGDAVTRPEYDSEFTDTEREGAESTLLEALRQEERAAATALASLVRASRVARAEDPDAADGALLGTASLLEEYLADWEVARLLAGARERVAVAEERAAEIVGRAEDEADRILKGALAELRELQSLAAAAATQAFAAVAWRDLRDKVRQIVFNRYRLHLPPTQGDGLDGYREHVRLIQLAQDTMPILFDAIMARVTGRAGATLRQVIRSDFGAAEWGRIDIDRLAELAEVVAAAVPEMGLEEQYEGLEEDLRELDYPAAAPGFASVNEILAATGGNGREEARAAVAVARSGRGRPVVPVAP